MRARLDLEANQVVHWQASIYDGSGHSPFWEVAPRFNDGLATFVRAAGR